MAKYLVNNKVGFSIDRVGNPNFEEETLYSELICGILDIPIANKGFSRNDLKIRDRIEDAMEGKKEGDKLKLEDQDAKDLQSINEQLHWPFRHKDITTFGDAIEKMKSTKKKN